MTMILHMLPVQNGDCFIVEFDDENNRKCRIVVDGGPAFTYKQLRKFFSDLPDQDRVIDLLIVTHIDEDHIGGIVSLLEDTALNVAVKEVWFNDLEYAAAPYSRRNMTAIETFGVPHGIRLAKLIEDLAIPWNEAFGRRAICLEPSGKAVLHSLTKNCEISLLSPSSADLHGLAEKWREEIASKSTEAVIDDTPEIETYGASRNSWEDLAKSDFDPDTSVTNLSSIAFLLKVGTIQVFFGGDASSPTVLNALSSLPHSPGTISAFKLSHHGSARNTCESLLSALPAEKYLFSANGRHGHPSLETIARVAKFGPADAELHFSYRTREDELAEVGLATLARREMKVHYGSPTKPSKFIL